MSPSATGVGSASVLEGGEQRTNVGRGQPSSVQCVGQNLGIRQSAFDIAAARQ